MIFEINNQYIMLIWYQNCICYEWNWCTPWYEKMLKSQLDTSQKAQAGHATWNYVYTFYYTTFDITWIQARGSMRGEILPFNTKYSNYLIVVTTITLRCTYTHVCFRNLHYQDSTFLSWKLCSRKMVFA